MAGTVIDVVIIDVEEESRRILQSILTDIHGIKVVGEARDFLAAYDVVKKLHPQLVVLNLYPSEDQALRLCEKIVQNFPDTILFVTSPAAKPETIIRAMRVGAREFLLQPLDRDEVLNATRQVLKNLKQSQDSRELKGKVIAVFGAKGGVGATTLATNLATTMAAKKKKDVLLMDLHLKLGNVALFLNVRPSYTILDMAHNLTDIDYDVLRRSLVAHNSGVKVLSGPPRIEDAEAVQPSHIEQILTVLRNLFDFIVIDVPATFDDVSITALDEADSILVVSSMELAAIYNSKNCLDVFQRMGYDSQKLKLVINRYPTPAQAVHKELEKSFGHLILQRIPNESYPAVTRSINNGEPFSAAMPDSKMGLSILGLTGSLNGHVQELPEEDAKAAGLLKKLLKK